MKQTLPFITAVALCCGCIFGGSDAHEKDLGPDGGMPDVAGDTSPPVDADNNVTPDLGPDMPPGVCDLVDCEVGSECDPMTGRCEPLCPPMLRSCGDRCVPVSSDIMNCGACDVRCEDAAPLDAHPRTCTDGACIFECNQGTADLDGDLNEPNSNGCESECVPTNPPVESCDGLDNDCNGFIDDGLPTSRWHRDLDGDSYGDPLNYVDTCADSGPEGYVTNGDDCVDSDPTIHPDALEVCDGIENDCNPQTVDADMEACAQTVFVTSAIYSGDLSPGGPDAVCQTHGVTLGAAYGTWRAIATVGGVGPLLRIRQIGEIQTPSGFKLWDAGDMFRQAGPSMPIVETESMTMIPDAQPPVWTGSASNGNLGLPTCQDWTTNSPEMNGRAGVAGVPLANWLNNLDVRSCDQLARLFCIDGQE